MEELNKGKRLKIGSLMILLFMMIYVPSLIHWVCGKSINTEILRMGTLEDSINTEGYLVRDEEILKSPFEGKCIADINEGDKVPVGSRVATILRDSSVKLLDDLKKKDLEILEAQKKLAENQEFFSEDIIKIDNEIQQKVRQVIADGNSNNLGKMKEYKEDINALIQKKATIFGGNSASDKFISSLKKQREEIQNQIKQNTKEIYSTSSGIISYVIDGYENILSPSGIKNMTPKFLEGIKPSNVPTSSNHLNLEVDKPFAKVIRDIESYIVVVLDEQRASDFGVDDLIDIRINDIAKVVSGTIDYKSEKQDGKFVLAIKINQGISETAGLRKINIDLIKSSYTGFKVPLKSLKDLNLKDMKAKIVLVKANCAKIKEVSIIGKNDEYAIVESSNKSGEVNLYDFYVTNPENIQEDQIINP